MTAPTDRRPDQLRATVPWPYVERRGGPRPLTAVVSIPLQTRRAVPALTSDAAVAGQTAPVGLRPPVGLGVTRVRWTRLLVAATVALDVLAAVLGPLAAYHLRFGGQSGEDRYLVGVVAAPVIWVSAVAAMRGYQSRWFGSGSEEFRCVLRAAACVAAGAAIASYLLKADLARGFVLLACVLVALASLVGRLVGRAGLRAARRRGKAMLDVVVVGHETTVVDLVRQVVREEQGGLRLVGACVPGGRSPQVEALGVPVLGDLHQVSAVVGLLQVHTVAVTACTEMGGAALRRLAWELEGSGIDLVVAPGLIDVAGPRLHIRPLCGLPLLHIEEPRLDGGRRVVKAACDRVISLLALVLLAPVLMVIAVAVRVESPGPVLFRQMRVGKDGREFRIRKFRTMHLDAEQRLPDLLGVNVHGDEVLFKVRQDPRVTRTGRSLRRFSLDELPQLVNVLFGQMSLVGPRPPLPREVARYDGGVHRRLLVKPGLTGLWQIGGRSDLSWDESIRLDLRYVENWSLSLDLMILWKTFSAVVGGRGAY